MKLTRILLCSSLFILWSSLQAQEHVVPLKGNPVLMKYAKEAKMKHGFVWRLISDSIMAKLPFLDDFSHGGPYPNDSLWEDNAAFINDNYPICPPTLGVATLDGVNGEGQPYNPNCPIGASEPADSLTSRPIDMTYNYLVPSLKLVPRDSVYFSFYWQAGGRGYAPLTNDSLILQFRTSTTPWTTVWYHLGYTPVAPDTGFHLVMLMMNNAMANVVDQGLTINPFNADFQFRFKNYACTSGNVDQWNIDEVYLAQQRGYRDTFFNDVSFVYESPSMLANYQYMPWEQFTCNDLTDYIHMYERYDGNSPASVNYSYAINTPSPSVYNGGYATIYPFSVTGYDTNSLHKHIPIKSQYNCNTLSGPTDYTLTNILTYSTDFNKWNDTLRFDQIFSDYYAYDDGSAEAAYFINGTTPLYLAYQFTLNKPDTLRGLDLYFNYLFVNQANYAFRLALWDNTGPGGSPGNLKFEDPTIYSPKFVDSLNNMYHDSLNGFVFYKYHFVHPDTAIQGTFYVGWVQTYGDSLNIGYDFNTDHHDKIYYNVGSGWNPGTYPGSMMMRPVFGTSNSHGPVWPSLASGTVNPYESLAIFPNPAGNKVTLTETMPANTILKIYSADGREIMNNSNFSGNSIDTSALPAGFYIVEVTPANGKTYYQKLLIQR